MNVDIMQLATMMDRRGKRNITPELKYSFRKAGIQFVKYSDEKC